MRSRAVEIIVDTSTNAEPAEIVIDGNRFPILGVTDRWYDPDARYFKVAAANGYAYLLRQDLETQGWSVEHVWLLDA